MARNIGTNGKLWSQAWEKATPFWAAKARVTNATRGYPDIARRAFSQSRERIYGGFTASRPAIAQYATRRSFTSGGILLLGVNPTTTGTNTACSGVVEKTICTAKGLERRKASVLAGQLWKRSIHLSSRQIGREAWKNGNKAVIITSHTTKRLESTKPEINKPHVADKPPVAHTKPVDPLPVDSSQTTPEGNSYFHLPHLPHLPKMPHRPTKEELLAAATGFWSRLKIRFKWFSIRSVRPWNVDDWSAFVSWFMLGHIVWILLGTTTFFSIIIFAINTVVAQGMLRLSR